LIHGYFAIDYTLLYEVTTSHIPELASKIEAVLQAII